MALQNNAGIVLTIFAFYICIIVLFGLVGSSQLQTNKNFDSPPDGILAQIAFFFQGIGFTIGSLPFWANSLIFLPLGITIGYILLEIAATAVP